VPLSSHLLCCTSCKRSATWRPATRTPPSRRPSALSDATIQFVHQAYADDEHIKAKLSVALELLSGIKHVLKEDAGLDLDFDKTKILVKGISAADAHAHAAAQRMLNADASLAHLSPLLSPASFLVDGYLALGFPSALMHFTITL